MLRKIIATVLIMCIILCVASCNNNSNDTPPITYTTSSKPDEVIMGTGKLSLYFSLSDSLNPYKSVSLGNQQLASLLFDPLVKLDADLNPHNVLAKEIQIIGKKCIIHLASAVFSDGSAITAEDVTFSIKQARASENGLYQAQLSNIYSYGAADKDTVEIIMKKADPNFVRVLDFPIIKSGTTKLEDSDKKELPPVGSGRYIYKDDNGVYSLIPNKKYIAKPAENTISLVNTPDAEALDFNIKTGSVDICYTPVTNGDRPIMGGGVSKVKQTNLVYIGFNSNRQSVYDSKIRLAIANFINRNDVCETAYYTYAQPALSPYVNGVDFAAKWQNMFSENENTKKSVEYLADLSYNKKDTDGYYVDAKGKRISVSLLYNTDNVFQKNAAELIIKQLKNSGVEVKAQGVSRDKYVSAVNAADYDMYLGEVKLNKNFDLSSLFSQHLVSVKTTATTVKTTVGTTDPTAPTTDAVKPEVVVEMDKVYNSYLEGKIKFDEFMSAFSEQMPFVPVCYRLGIVSYSAQITPAAVASVSDAYFNIELLSVK
ncbi:MAG: ABC transporter substrate-binding protein [Clostridia bacterium]|nr:ABC transporter substrate-binding protein [Clostridia bacterium]